jgi:arylsulfatase A-like enzyme
MIPALAAAAGSTKSVAERAEKSEDAIMTSTDGITRREFMASSVAATAAVGLRPAPAADRKPNILFVLADDLGYGDLGCYGQERIQTPNIDRLAAEGIRFIQTYAGSTVCAPSRCSLMTGKHTGHATVRGNARPELGLAPNEVTVPMILKKAGYNTALFGKWGLGGPGTGSAPNNRGFDEFYGFLDQLHAHNSYPEHLWENQNEVFLTDNWFFRRKLFANDLFTEHAIEFLKRRRQNPFSLYLAYTVPHANNELGSFTGNGIEVPTDAPYSDRDWPQLEKNYAAMITRMDTDIGRILDLLRQQGLDEDTIVFFTSDNGPHREGGHNPEFFRSAGPLRGIKRDLYEGGIRVPAIVRWPGKVTARKVDNTPWAFWDFLPTAAELAGHKPPGGLDGISIVSALQGKALKPRDYFYWEFHEGGFAQAVRRGDWKLVRQAGKALELYDLSSDLSERSDLAAQLQDILSSLLKLFTTARTDSDRFPVKSGK